MTDILENLKKARSSYSGFGDSAKKSKYERKIAKQQAKINKVNARLKDDGTIRQGKFFMKYIDD